MAVPLIALLLVPLRLSCALAEAEDFTAIETEPQVLLAGLESYSSPEAVAAALGNPSWEVKEQSGLRQNDKRPPFNVLSVSLAPFQDRGHRGELQLTFFNSRLMSTAFYPHHPEAYRASLGRFPPRDVRGGELWPKYLRVWNAVDYKGREYFLWGDERLLAQRNRWIMKYSSRPSNPPLQATATAAPERQRWADWCGRA